MKHLSLLFHSLLYGALLIYTLIFLRSSVVDIHVEPLLNQTLYVWLDPPSSIVELRNMVCTLTETVAVDGYANFTVFKCDCEARRCELRCTSDPNIPGGPPPFLAPYYINITDRNSKNLGFPYGNVTIFYTTFWALSIQRQDFFGAIEYDMKMQQTNPDTSTTDEWVTIVLGSHVVTSLQVEYDIKEVAYLSVLLIVATVELVFFFYNNCKVTKESIYCVRNASSEAEATSFHIRRH